jgi:hypothetical protein
VDGERDETRRCLSNDRNCRRGCMLHALLGSRAFLHPSNRASAICLRLPVSLLSHLLAFPPFFLMLQV